MVNENFLLFRASSVVCAIPLAHVVETLRPLSLRPFAAAPEFVAGLSVVRGTPTPVIDLGTLLGQERNREPARWVTLRVGERSLVLAVGEVLGIRALSDSARLALPPLLAKSEPRRVESVGSLDAELLLVLQAARILPDEIWKSLDIQRAESCP